VTRLVAAAAFASALAAAGAAAAPAPRFDHWLGFRTRGDGVYCFGTAPAKVWTGFICFRPRNGFFVKMDGRDLSTRVRVRITKGFDARLRSYRDRRVGVVRDGASWASSDAEMVKCWVRSTGLICRYYYGGRFALDRSSGYRIVPQH